MYYELVIRTAGIVALLVGMGLSDAQARQDNAAVRAVDAVIGFRRTVMADTLKFDACSVFSATGRPADFPAGIGPANRPSLDRAGRNPCDGGETHARLPHRVYVDSLALTDSLGYVHLTVRRGELVHRETFVLPRIPGGWGVREARVWGAMQVALPPPD